MRLDSCYPGRYESRGPGRMRPGAGMIVIDGEAYVESQEAARLLGIKRATLYAYVSRGLLRSYRQGIKRQRLYRRADVDELLRLSPGGRAEAEGVAAGPTTNAPEIIWSIPLAESWIRDLPA